MRYFAILPTVLSAVAGIASAFTTPTTGPIGNPISKPSLHEKVPVGKPYTITWEPTLHPEGTVTLVLVKGPSNNVIPQFAIVEKTPNNGHYVWTPDASFPDSIEGYGIQLIVDATGQYQWSTQFGFANTGIKDTSTSTTKTTYPDTTTADEKTTATGYPHTTTTEKDYATSTTEIVYTTSAPVKNTTTTTVKPITSTTKVETTTDKPVYPTAPPKTLTTKVATTGNVTYAPTKIQTPVPTVTGSGVGKNAASYGIALLAVVVAGFSLF